MLIKTFLETAGTFQEREILTRFHAGIKQSVEGNTELEKNYLIGDGAYLELRPHHTHCDVSVMFGSWKNRDKQHHMVRANVAESSRCFIILETPLLSRKVEDTHNQYRIGVNGFLNNTGFFYKGNQPSDRFNALGLTWDGWKNKQDGHVVLMMQLPGDASLRGINLYDWATYTICRIREYSKRQIRIRTHPAHNIKDSDEFHKFFTNLLMTEKLENIVISDGKEVSLKQDLEGAYCTVTYSSGSGIDSVINGIPTISTDPANFAWDISSRYVSDIEHISKADENTVRQWLYNLAYCQWSVAEMQNGDVWNHLFPIIEEVLVNTAPRKKK
jgi:hypothetical protein